MTRLTRKHQKLFAGQASNNGVFGSLQANNPQTSSDVATLQSLPAFDTGWEDATFSADKLPPLEEFQGVQYGISYQQCYMLQEGIPEWEANTTYYIGGFVKEITSTGFRLYISIADNNTGNIVSNMSYWKKVMDSDDLYVATSDFERNIYVGDIKQSLQTANHGNWLLCDGQEIYRNNYPELFALIGEDFGSGDGSTTFNLPDYRGKFLRGLGGDSAADIYTTQAEGLPNITGTFVSGTWTSGGATGAFYETGQNHGQDASGNDSRKIYGFNASRSNSIYGASSHVTPINQAVNYFIRAKV